MVLMNIDTKKAVTMQVKGSKAFEPKKNELKKYGHGNVGWFCLEEKTIFGATAEYFIFLIYVIIISSAWNYWPHKKLDGLSPAEKSLEYQ